MTELTDDAGFLLSRASGLVARATNAALAEHGLRVRHYSVLVLACGAAEGMSQRDLACRLGLDPSQVVQLVDELADAGLVERRPSATDRRTKLVAGTPLGQRVRRQAARRATRGQQRPLGCLNEEEQATLRALLSRVVDSAG
ncbi:MarR family winged helix-turn-helix transcriptional regulator [Modestobacter lapidis]|nr:MarR family transcriptional regulator [Modestobacter lapidis]